MSRSARNRLSVTMYSTLPLLLSESNRPGRVGSGSHCVASERKAPRLASIASAVLSLSCVTVNSRLCSVRTGGAGASSFNVSVKVLSSSAVSCSSTGGRSTVLIVSCASSALSLRVIVVCRSRFVIPCTGSDSSSRACLICARLKGTADSQLSGRAGNAATPASPCCSCTASCSEAISNSSILASSNCARV